MAAAAAGRRTGEWDRHSILSVGYLAGWLVGWLIGVSHLSRVWVSLRRFRCKTECVQYVEIETVGQSGIDLCIERERLRSKYIRCMWEQHTYLQIFLIMAK